RSVRRLISLFTNARIIVHVHGHISDSNIAQVPLVVRGADVVVAASRAIAMEIPRQKAVVVHAGLEPSTAPRAAGRYSDRIVIGTACRLVPATGRVGLIWSLALLTAEFPCLRLEIAGAGPDADVLKDEAKRLGVIEWVRFLGWRRDLGRIFRNWDMFALSSHEEGFGLAALEAMAAGLPVVATAVGGLPEIIVDGETGYLVPPADATALAGRLRLLILDEQRRAAMGVAGEKRVRCCFSVDSMVAKTAAIYEDLLSSSSP